MFLGNFWLFLLFFGTFPCFGLFLVSFAEMCWVLLGFAELCKVLLSGALEGCIWPGASEVSERSERTKLSGASSGFPWPIVHALLCCCLVLFSACCCCFGCFCFCWTYCPLLEILVPCSCMLQQLSKLFALPVHLSRQVFLGVL